MRRWAVAVVFIVCGLVMTAHEPALADEHHPATCASYIGALEAGVRSQDPLAVQAYINLADSMYQAINKAVVARGAQPLPLPDDEDAEARRAMVVANECKENPALRYAEAVSSAYVRMRRASGLSVQLPSK